MEFLSTLWSQILYALLSIRVFDIVDILAISFIIYQCTKFFRQNRAGQLLKGLGIFLIIFVLANWFQLLTLKWLLMRVADSIIIVAVIIFQPELRRLLESVGRSNLARLNKNSGLAIEDSNVVAINDICKAVSAMSDSKTGALIVFERNTPLAEIVNTGTYIDASISTEIVQNVFFPKSPLHDGAVVVKGDRLLAAGCILPLTANNQLNSQLGTRHRAAIGMTEGTDALVVVVSEETGNISLAVDGKLTRDYSMITLKEELNGYLLVKTEEEKGFLKEVLKFFKKNKTEEN